MSEIDEVAGRLNYQRKRLTEVLAIHPVNGNVLIAVDHRCDALARSVLELIDTTEQLALIVKNLKP